jgi:hypothetical protein
MTYKSHHNAVPAFIKIIRNGVGHADELESQCFKIYLEDTAKEISAPFPSSLWERLIPQISEVEPFVRHAVIAIGALSRYSKTGKRAKGVQIEDYHHALTQYGKAIRGMREAIANGHHDLRKALIACLLVFCFEGMLGNQASASQHAESGLMLLHQWSTRKNTRGSPWLTQRPWKDHPFEGDLLEAFTALDSQVLIFMDHRTVSEHQKTKAIQNQLISTMPPQIFNLDLARQFWKLIINRNYHFSKQIQATARQKEQEVGMEDLWEGSAKMGKDDLLLSATSSESTTLKQEHVQYEGDIDRWCLACESLTKEIAAGTNQREKVGAAILQVQTKLSRIMLAGTFFTTETEYDVYLPEFTAIVNLSEGILSWILSSYSGCNPRFNFDVGIVAALFLVASRCRFDNVRKKAIDMLFAANYREGIWDALAVAQISKWLRDIELEDIGEQEVVPEEKRAVLIAVDIDLFNQRALLGASQGSKGSGVKRKTILTW